MIVTHDIYAETNPAFCSLVISQFCNYYKLSVGKNPNIVLVYLILPLVLSNDLDQTFLKTNIKTGLLVWLDRNPSILINLDRRINSTLDISTEAIKFGCLTTILNLEDDGTISADISTLPRIKNNNAIMIKKSRQLGYWFSEMGSARATLEAMGLSL
ncbi:DUF6521 family protein [Providencia rettgeri]|uniref:three component ABC system middle component n=1 Tax=Providencia rettgeri TaxID=587 RepID=UPI001EFE4243|nr:three component ABC system middle component [Providencia rettgeri]MCG9524928.1 DUF6521 family protein [Providencia rettgeri]